MMLWTQPEEANMKVECNEQVPAPLSAHDLAGADAVAFGTGATQTDAQGTVRHVPQDAWVKALNDVQTLTYERTRVASALAEVQRVLKVSGSGDDGLSAKRVAELLNRIGPVLDDVNERQRLRDNPPMCTTRAASSAISRRGVADVRQPLRARPSRGAQDNPRD